MHNSCISRTQQQAFRRFNLSNASQEKCFPCKLKIVLSSKPHNSGICWFHSTYEIKLCKLFPKLYNPFFLHSVFHFATANNSGPRAVAAQLPGLPGWGSSINLCTRSVRSHSPKSFAFMLSVSRQNHLRRIGRKPGEICNIDAQVHCAVVQKRKIPPPHHGKSLSRALKLIGFDFRREMTLPLDVSMEVFRQSQPGRALLNEQNGL